jgi:LytS/YehU family sensor histidine kinase
MNLETDNKHLIFEISNSIPNNGVVKSGSGKGIENTKQRLKILYPDKHKLEIKNDHKIFRVILKITLV